jgi:hypothetical protein
MDILLTGCAVTPEEALRIGMITRVVPDGEALRVARDWRPRSPPPDRRVSPHEHTRAGGGRGGLGGAVGGGLVERVAAGEQAVVQRR